MECSSCALSRTRSLTGSTQSTVLTTGQEDGWEFWRAGPTTPLVNILVRKASLSLHDRQKTPCNPSISMSGAPCGSALYSTAGWAGLSRLQSTHCRPPALWTAYHMLQDRYNMPTCAAEVFAGGRPGCIGPGSIGWPVWICQPGRTLCSVYLDSYPAKQQVEAA